MVEKEEELPGFSGDNLPKEEDNLAESPLTQAGRLVFCCFVDPEKLQQIFSQGLKPLGVAKSKSASQFPDRVSLSALSEGGYLHSLFHEDTLGASHHYFVKLTATKGLAGKQIEPQNGFSVAILLDTDWLECNIGKFLGVGDCFVEHRQEKFRVGALTQLPLAKEYFLENYPELIPFFDEVWFAKDEVVPPEAFGDIVIADPNGREFAEIIQLVQSAYPVDKPLRFWDQQGDRL